MLPQLLLPIGSLLLVCENPRLSLIHTAYGDI